MKKILSLILVLAVVLSFSMANAEETLNGAGATFPYPVYSAWAYDYHKITGVKLNYQSIGSGGGIRQITNRTVDFGGSDNVLTPQDLNKDNLLQFPAVMGGVVPVVNIPGVKEGELRLDSDAVCKIFLGEIKQWNDKKIKDLNPKLNLPDKEITVVHRSDGSGTTAIYTHYLSGACPAWKDKVGYGTSVKWPVGIGGKGNEGVANYVKRTPNSIGYVEFAYAKQNKLAHTLLKNPAGNFVEPSFDTFEDAAATADFDAKNHFATWLTNAPGKNSWPIAGATFILLAKEKRDSNMKTVKFFDWAFKNGDAKAKELIYIPMPKSLKDKIRAYWKANGIY
ncbi:MAG: phosphate ABC transporter substrate-binding protein PstS [Nitrospirae bacterium]|nr:phosphate ABC transporter substrate-binding protein PstS [Nitrospirota bacterium]MDA8339869.1 phosphate ABC transporter substrate-binding protein PstS [Nitrospiraceae bacterium]